MRRLFKTRDPLPTLQRSRWAIWCEQFEDGQGPLFWLAAVLGAVGLYGLMVAVLVLS